MTEDSDYGGGPTRRVREYRVCTYDFPPVRFLGVWDAVGSFGIGAMNRSGSGQFLPELGWNFQSPGNVQHFAHIRRFDDGRWFFDTEDMSGNVTEFWPLTHGQVGYDTGPYDSMVREARSAGVNVR